MSRRNPPVARFAESERTAMIASMDPRKPRPARVSRAVALALVGSLALVFLLVTLLRSSGVIAPSPRTNAGAASMSAAVGATPIVAPSSTMVALPIPASVAPSRPQNLTDEQREAWLAMMHETRQTLLEKTKYPPTSLPLAPKLDLQKPHTVASHTRGLAMAPDGGRSNVSITLSQSQLWLADGDVASAFIQVTTANGDKPNVQITRANLHKTDATGDALGTLVGPVLFHDDGVAPDTASGDLTFSASVPQWTDALRGKPTGLVLEVDMVAGEEHGTFRFNFITTGAVPAKFTGVVHDAIEGGSLAFHIGIEVYRAGRYSLMARVYDADGKPAVLLTDLEELSPETREVVMVAFGKALLDQGLRSPFVLRDLEGFLFVAEKDTDRAVMAVWPGPYTTAEFPMTQLSDKEWDSPQRSARIDAIDGVINHGPSEIAPVDSNGIPLPPKPIVVPKPR
jgi:hypothetical protein